MPKMRAGSLESAIASIPPGGHTREFGIACRPPRAGSVPDPLQDPYEVH